MRLRTDKMKNITTAKMPNLGAAIWLPQVMPELLLSHYQNLLNFTNAFKCYHRKCKLASL